VELDPAGDAELAGLGAGKSPASWFSWAGPVRAAATKKPDMRIFSRKLAKARSA
jgi:hypothetical protein